MAHNNPVRPPNRPLAAAQCAAMSCACALLATLLALGFGTRGDRSVTLALPLILNSCRIAGLASLTCIAIALLLVSGLLQARPRLRALLLVALFGSLVLPVILRTFGWMAFWQLFGHIRSDPTAARGGLLAVVLGLAHLYVPFVAVALLRTCEEFPRSQLQAASALGYPPSQVLYKIFLPQRIDVLIAAFVLVFLLSVSAYVTPVILGSGGQTMIVEEILRRLNIELAASDASLPVFLLLFIQIVGVAALSSLGARRE